MPPPDDKHQQYFLAIIPPDPTFDEVAKLKHYFREIYHSKAALNSPPHITLHMPFRWRIEKEKELTSAITGFTRQHNPFKICLDNFSSFEPRVIFINVINTVDLSKFQLELKRFCRRELNLLNSDYKDQAFHPHVTLAFRDLKKAAYHLAWEEFKNKEFKAEFMADKLTLLKHNGRHWEQFHHFPLTSSYTTSADKKLEGIEG